MYVGHSTDEPRNQGAHNSAARLPLERATHVAHVGCVQQLPEDSFVVHTRHRRPAAGSGNLGVCVSRRAGGRADGQAGTHARTIARTHARSHARTHDRTHARTIARSHARTIARTNDRTHAPGCRDIYQHLACERLVDCGLALLRQVFHGKVLPSSG